jgi:cbb3-type cytochrome oxidase cytochrome c subunit
MKGLAPLFLGIFGTFAFSWVGLTVIPNWQIGNLNPQSDEEGTEIYPQRQSGMFQRGAHVYAANGCVYCHSQQIRADYIANDIDRKWGDRRSAPRDYIFQRPVFLGKMRMGQDLANIGARAPAPEGSPSPAGGASPSGAGATQGTAASPAAPPAASPSPATASATSHGTSPAAAASPNASPPALGQMANTAPGGSTPAAPSAQTPGAPYPIQTANLPPMYSAAWHHVHLFAPRSINPDSNMPSYRFLYRTRRITGERSADALQLRGSDAPPDGWEIVPTFDAKCVVAYLMGLNQSHPLKEVRSVGGAPATGGAPSPAAPGAPPAPAAGGSPAAPK